MNFKESNPQIGSTNLQKDSSMNTVKAVKELQAIMDPISEDQISFRKLEKEFNLLNKLTTGNENFDRLIQHKQFQSLNRYSDILPYKETIVNMNDKIDLSSENYINANFISNPFVEGDVRNFIATQGPLEHTASHFWKMIELFKVATIVSIVEHQAMGSRCFQYWPADHFASVEPYKITVKQKHETALYRFKVLEITNKSTEKSFEVSHFHIFGWVDHSTLNNNEIHDYIKLLEKLRRDMEDESTGPAVVHCSAGVGRTGVFIASYYLYNHWLSCQRVQKKFTFSIFALVRNLREQRFGFVQTSSQYLFLYQLVKYFKA